MKIYERIKTRGSYWLGESDGLSRANMGLLVSRAGDGCCRLPPAVRRVTTHVRGSDTH